MLCALYVVEPTGLTQQTLSLPEGSSLGEALASLGWTSEALHAKRYGVSRFEKKVSLDIRLREGDEITPAAPTLVDPKLAREARAKEQGDVRLLTCGRHGGRHRKLAR